jgi:hypothetical protein
MSSARFLLPFLKILQCSFSFKLDICIHIHSPCVFYQEYKFLVYA